MKSKILSILALLCITASSAWATLPNGVFESAKGNAGSVTVRGWAYDPDASSSSITIHVYVWKKGVNEGDMSHPLSIQVVEANVERSDVNETVGITGNHGFQKTFTMEAENYVIKAFAIDNEDANSHTDLPINYGGIETIREVTVYPTTYDVTANSASEAYWATFYSNAGNYQAPEGTQVFTVSLAGTGITMHEVSDRIAKSGQGVVLKKTTTGSFTMTLTETAPAGNFSSNSLTGTMTQINTTGANNYYVLGGKNGAGFYKLSNTSGTIGANKAYLTYSGTLARQFFLFDETTGIEMPTAEDGDADAEVFDLQGRRVTNPTKGLYIVNGKKVFINK